MTGSRPLAACPKCGLVRQVPQRGSTKLCWSCHDWSRPETGVYCCCRTPTIERIPLFATAQCGHCKRPFRPERAA